MRWGKKRRPLYPRKTYLYVCQDDDDDIIFSKLNKSYNIDDKSLSDTDLASFFYYKWSKYMSVNEFNAGSQTCLDGVSLLNVSADLKGQKITRIRLSLTLKWFRESGRLVYSSIFSSLRRDSTSPMRLRKTVVYAAI